MIKHIAANSAVGSPVVKELSNEAVVVPKTLGEMDALPEEEQRKAWRQAFEQAFAKMLAREEAYLQGDYAPVGSRRSHEWGD
jgi:hypothetical protein